MSAPEPAAPTITLSSAEVASIPVDKAFCMKSGKLSLIAFKSADGSLKIAQNTCLHMSQSFSPDVEDAGMLVCGMHGAKLDAKTMTYSRGPKVMGGLGTKVDVGTPQPVFAVHINGDGSATLTPPAGMAATGGCSVC